MPDTIERSRWRMRPDFFTGPSDDYILNGKPISVDADGCFEIKGEPPQGLSVVAKRVKPT
jgi:hypothetical protein